MGQGTYANEVNALLGIVADGIERNAARRLCLKAMVDDVNGLLSVRNGEVVEHNTVNAAVVEHLLKFLKRAHLNLNLQVKVLFLQVLVATVQLLQL